MKKEEKFYFSASTNAFQVEGARNLHGRTDSLWDHLTKAHYYVPPIGSTEREISDISVAADFYHKYKSDVRGMKKLGLQSFVYNMDWARIFPKDDEYVNPMGIQFYDNMFKELVDNGIKPIPILFHWDTPIWLEFKGGWNSKESLKAFRSYVKTVFKYLGKYTDLWFVNDENSNFTIGGYLGDGNFKPPYKKTIADWVSAVHNLVMSAAICKEEFEIAKQKGYLAKNARLGIDHDWSPPGLFDKNEKNKEDLLENYNSWMRDLWLDPNILGEYPQVFWDLLKKEKLDAGIIDGELEYIKKFTCDFIGWNFYRPCYITWKDRNLTEKDIHGKPVQYKFGDFKIVFPKKDVKYTKWLMPIAPEFIKDALKKLEDKYKLPIFVGETGMGDFDDKSKELILDYDRIDYLKGVIDAVEEARKENINVFGLSIWTYCDIFSPSAGYRKDYGVVAVDFNSPILERKPKLSFSWYKQVIKSDGKDTSVNKAKLERELKQDLSEWDIFYK